jgi:hypothetical protein
MTRPARTWIVSAVTHSERTEEVDHLARSAEEGLSYLTGEEMPPYLGVWADPNGNRWHLFSDYPADHHERFGWALDTLKSSR